MKLHEQRTVRRPPSEVFAYTADFSHIADWDPGIVRSRSLTEGPVGPGSRFEVEAKFGTSTMPMVYEITDYQPPSRVVLVGRGENLEAVDTVEFIPDGDGTRIDYTADLRFHGPIRYLIPLLIPALRRVGRRAVDGLTNALDR